MSAGRGERPRRSEAGPAPPLNFADDLSTEEKQDRDRWIATGPSLGPFESTQGAQDWAAAISAHLHTDERVAT